MSTRVYISGPMTGYVNHNFDAFHAAAAHLRSRGFDVISPAELDVEFGMEDASEFTHAQYLARDLPALLTCDAIYMLPGWRYSKGAGIENQVARAVGIPELHETDLDLWRTFEGEPEVQDSGPDFEAESPDDEPEVEESDGSADYATRPPGGYSDILPPVPYAVGDRVLVNNPICDPAWNGPAEVVAVNDPACPVLTLPNFPVAVRPLSGPLSDQVGGFRLEHLSPYPSRPAEGGFFVAPVGTPVEETDKWEDIGGTVSDLADHPRFGSVFEDIEIEVDDSLPPNTLRLDYGAGSIDFDVSRRDGEIRLDLRSPQPGDEFPNVGYVRHMLGLLQAAEEHGERRSA